MPTPKNSTNQVVLVIGASSGIGLAAAKALVERGHRVYGTSRDASRIATPGVVGVDLEVGSESSVRRAVDRVLADTDQLDAVFYAAGFYTAGAVEETTPEQVQDQLDAYLVGAHRVVRAVLPKFRDAGAGRLMFVSSGAGDSSLPFHTIYSASKAALQGYCDGLRYEVEPFGIEVAYFQAGGVKTGAKAGFRRAGDAIEAYSKRRERAIAAFHRMQDKGPVPRAVGRAVADAVTVRRLKPIIRVDAFSRLMPLLKLLIPSSIFRSQIKKSLDLRDP